MAWILLAVLAAVVDLVALATGAHALRAVTKPLPAILLALALLRAPGDRRVRLAALGLLFAAVGDEWLLHSSQIAFAAGMLAFAAMHVAYIVTFVRLGSGSGTVARRPWLALFFALAVIAVVAILAPQAGTFAVPLAVYAALLGAMALCAVDAAGRVAPRSRAALVAGALLFMLSDTLLAFTTFATGFPNGIAMQLAIMATYFTAQIALTGGLLATTSS